MTDFLEGAYAVAWVAWHALRLSALLVGHGLARGEPLAWAVAAAAVAGTAAILWLATRAARRGRTGAAATPAT